MISVEREPAQKQETRYPEIINGVPVGEIIRSILSLHHGRVQIFVQDSKVIQIDKTEKKRLINKPGIEYHI